jgi:hypothetical protein
MRLETNPWTKPQQWFARSAHMRRGFNEPCDWKYEGQTVYVQPIELQTVIPQTDVYNLPKVRCIPHIYRGQDPKEHDGAQLLLRPDAQSSSPFQGNEGPHIFRETPLSGRLIFLGVDSRGQLIKHFFDMDDKDNSPHSIIVEPGEIMSWFACNYQGYRSPLFPNSPLPSYVVLEDEFPGFSTAKLTEIPYRSTNFNHVTIPTKFWDTHDLLQKGREDEVIKSTPSFHQP